MNHKFEAMSPTTEFGKWLYTKMCERGMTCVDVATLLHITRQNVAFHINGHHTPNFPFVVAYCWLFDVDPYEIWKLVEQDKTR